MKCIIGRLREINSSAIKTKERDYIGGFFFTRNRLATKSFISLIEEEKGRPRQTNNKQGGEERRNFSNEGTKRSAAISPQRSVQDFHYHSVDNRAKRTSKRR
jgi:hypothetical protein